MTSSPHDCYRRELVVLTIDTVILCTLGEQCPPWAQGRTWRRRYGRFYPHEEPYARLVLEAEGEPQVILHADVFHAHPAEVSGGASVLPIDSLGWLRVRRFPADRSLDTLPALLAAHEDAVVLRYRPGRRCTLRIRENGRHCIAKLYPERFVRNGRGEEIHAAGLALWRASMRGELSFAVARPYAWEPQSRTLWQQQVEGESMRAQLFGSHGESAAYQMGQATGSLNRCSIKPARVFDQGRQLIASRRYADELISLVPRLAPVVTQLLEALGSREDRGDRRPYCPIHGDLEAGQWLRDGPTLCLLDSDEFALGDPELDAASFLHEIELEHEIRHSDRMASLSGAFLEGYRSVAGALRPELLAAYLAHRRLCRALTLARALRADGDDRAEQLLGLALADFVQHRGVATEGAAWSH